MGNEVVHENERYRVEVTSEGYSLINIDTGVVEKEGTCLPEMIGEAENSNSYIKHEAWRWVDAQIAQQVEQATAWFGQEVDVTLDEDDGDTGSNLLN